jgi:LuxR family maltose regulon positive regulatory protein
LRTYLKQVAHHFNSEPPSDVAQWHGLRAEFNTLNAVLHYIDGDSDQAIDLSGRALKDLVKEAQVPKSYALCILSFGHQMNGNLNLALDVLHKALEGKAPNETALQSRLLIALSLVYWIAADLTGMRQAAGRVLALYHDTNLPESVGVANHMLGIFHYLRNEPTKANEYLKVVVQNPLVPSMLNFAHSTVALALSFEAQGRSDEARELVEKVINKALDSRSSEFLQLAEAFQAELLLRQGQLARAQAWAKNYDPYPFDPGYRIYVPQFTFVKVLLAENSPESLQQVTDLLSELHGHYSSIHNIRFLIEVLILQAWQHDALGQELKALQNLREALVLAEPGGFIRPFLDLGDPLAVILQRLVKQEPGQGYARQVLEAFRTERTNLVQTPSDDQSPTGPSGSNQALPDPLTGREVQILQVLSQGLSNQAIAEKLFISPETVKRHLYNIFQKLDSKNRQQAIIRAKSLGIV